MFQPDSGAIVIMLMMVFAGLICCVMRSGRLAVRLGAAVLAFAPAGLSGVAAVNMYYGYYRTWSAIAADFSGGGIGSYPALPDLGARSAARLAAVLNRSASLQAAAARGITVRLQVPGALSRVSRPALIYLPAQYFQPAYAGYRFPVIELMHGFPGQPQDWINVLQVTTALAGLTAAGRADPAVLVMPEVNGPPRRWSEQCLNQVGGQQDAAYLARDVPAYVAARLRVVPPGPGWGIAGYSAGGYCAANLALGYPHRYGSAAVMSGYFTPMDNINAGRPVDPFGGSIRLRQHNSPLRVVSRWSPRVPMPRFWLSAAYDDSQDRHALTTFRLLLRQHLPAVPAYLSGGGHTAAAWRAALPRMLEWMTPLLARAPPRAGPIPPQLGQPAPAGPAARPVSAPP
jgi:enterochelin esterase-like enzyme